jgi:hypothetical protein
MCISCCLSVHLQHPLHVIKVSRPLFFGSYLNLLDHVRNGVANTFLAYHSKKWASEFSWAIPLVSHVSTLIPTSNHSSFSTLVAFIRSSLTFAIATKSRDATIQFSPVWRYFFRTLNHNLTIYSYIITLKWHIKPAMYHKKHQLMLLWQK